MRRLLLIGLFSLATLFLSGCIYRPDVQQGNVIADSDLQGLHIGMTRDEVRSLLGDPVLVDVFDERRTIYVYTFKHAHQRMEEKRLVIYLSSNRVTSFWVDRWVGGRKQLPTPAL